MVIDQHNVENNSRFFCPWSSKIGQYRSNSTYPYSRYLLILSKPIPTTNRTLKFPVRHKPTAGHIFIYPHIISSDPSISLPHCSDWPLPSSQLEIDAVDLSKEEAQYPSYTPNVSFRLDFSRDSDDMAGNVRALV